MVRRPEQADAQLQIYGPLEARLTQSDRVIIGGLVEGVWPPAPRDRSLAEPADAARTRPRSAGAAHRPLRARLRAIARRRRRDPQSRRQGRRRARGGLALPAPAGGGRGRGALEAPRYAAGEKYVRFADALDRPDKVEPIPQPAPKPPRATRPLKLSVTAIEDWLRDPYTIYAKYILRLNPLDPVDMPLSAADRGSAIHDALGEFTQTFADDAARRSRGRLARDRREIFRAADGAARGARAVVAALPAHRQLVCGLGNRPARRHRRASTPRSGAKSRSPRQ